MIETGNSLDLMRDYPADFFDAVVTDPPYGLDFQAAKGWDKDVPGRAFWEQALRVVKPGSYLVAFGGTRTYHRLAMAIESAGWEIRDMLEWLYGSGFPKAPGVLKPAHEPICLARKPGRGGLFVHACTVGEELIHRRIQGVPKIGAFQRAQGGVTQAHNGRYPANVCHDGSECVEANLGSAARYFYCAKPSPKEKTTGAGHNEHVTVKPVALMRWLVRLVCPPGGWVLDPFCGSGTTGAACIAEGITFLGLELDPTMAQFAQARLDCLVRAGVAPLGSPQSPKPTDTR